MSQKSYLLFKGTYVMYVIRYLKHIWLNLSLQEVFRCLKWCIYFSFSFIDAVHMMHIMIEVIANKSYLRVTWSNIDTIMMLTSLTKTLTPKSCQFSSLKTLSPIDCWLFCWNVDSYTCMTKQGGLNLLK